MFYRVLQLRYAPDNRQAVIDYINSIEPEARQLNVMKSGAVIETAEGESVAVIGYDSEAGYNAASERINALLGGMMPLLSEPPTAVSGNDVWHMS